MKLLNLLRYKFSNNFYIRMLILYSSVVIVSLLFLLTIFITYQNNNLREQKLESNMNLVSQFRIYSDQYLVDKVYKIMTKDVFNKTAYELEIIDDTSAYVYNAHDFSKALALKKFLYNLHVNTDFIVSIDAYNKEQDTYVSSISGIFYNISQRRQNYNSIINYELLDTIASQNKNQLWVPPYQNQNYYKNNDIVSFVQLMPIFVPAEETNTVFIINIDIIGIYKEYFSKINTNFEEFKIIDDGNKIIFDTDKETRLNEELDQQMLKKINEDEEGYELIKGFEGKERQLIWVSSTINDWKYAYIVDDSNMFTRIITSLGGIIFGFIIIFILVLVAILFISRWLYKPLHNLVNLSKNRLEEPAGEGDISSIRNAFTKITSKVNQLENVIEKNNSLILNNILNDLLNSKISNINMLNERLGFINKRFELYDFYIMVTKIDENLYNKLAYDEVEMLHITGNEILSEYFGTHYGNSFKATTIYNYKGYFTTIINISPENYEEEGKDANEILKILNERFGEIFNIGISKPIKELWDFNKYYNNVLKFFKYSYIHGNNNVFDEKSYIEYENRSTHITTDVIKDFEELLKKHNIDLLKENLTRLFGQLRIQGYSFLYTYNLAIQLIGAISHETSRNNLNNEELGQQYLLTNYSKISNLDDCLDWFNNVVEIYCNSIEERNTNIGNTYINDIMKYIGDNVDSQLSLNSVAEHFKLSTGHLSRLFKEKTGKNFSDFVSEAKFEKAAQLLLLESKLKISDIAGELGYSNVTYFTKLFKSKYGVTPTQYRKINKNSLDK